MMNDPRMMQNMGAMTQGTQPAPQFGAPQGMPPQGGGMPDQPMPPMAPGEDEEIVRKRRSAIADMLRSMGKGSGLGMMLGAAGGGSPMAALAGAALGAGGGYLADQFGGGGGQGPAQGAVSPAMMQGAMRK